MKEDIKLYARISGKSFFRWLFIAVSGIALTIVLFLVVLFQNISTTGEDERKKTVFIIDLAMDNTGAFLLLAGAPIFILLYIILANKIAIHHMIFQIWKNKAVHYVEPAVKNIVERATSQHNGTIKVAHGAMLKARLLQENRQDKRTSPINKRVIGYGLKKIRLDDIDFANEKVSLTTIISDKLKAYISATAEPGYLLVWLLAGFQLILFACSRYFS